jgi:uncharacterized delta-60 repeat protein
MLSASSLDTTFGTLGVKTTDVGTSSSDFSTGITIQSDGKIVVTGTTDANGPVEGVLARYTPRACSIRRSASAATSFLGAYGFDDAISVTTAPGNKLVVAGTSGTDFIAARVSSAGVLDGAFGGTGVVIVDTGFTDMASAVAVRPTGEVLIAGTSDPGPNTDFSVVQLTSSGLLDPSFGYCRDSSAGSERHD